MIYFSSDLHLNHKAVIYLSGRPFPNIDMMNHTLIDNINSTVGENDTLYLLGDISYRGSKATAEELIGKIRCKNIYLCKGNHDRKYNPELFKEIVDYKEIHYGNELIVLMHYPLEEWKRSRHGSIHLHGHIHSKYGKYNTKMREKGIRRYDVGVDANNYKPVSIEDIVKFMSITTTKCS